MANRMQVVCAFIGLVILAGFLGGAGAGVYYVPDDYPTIQEAINAAQDGDEVIVRPGTYYERIEIIGKAVYLHSEAGPTSTVIEWRDLSGWGLVKVENGDGVVIEGFTIRNGMQIGVYCYNSPSVRLSNNIVTGNKGSGILCEGSTVTVSNSTIGNNNGMLGGGIWARNSTLTVIDADIEANTADYGGGIYSEGPALTVSNSRIRGNVARKSVGGGIGCANATVLLVGCEITNNTITNEMGGDGGGVNARECDVTIMDCVVSDNIIAKEGGLGGGIYFSASDKGSLRLVNNRIMGNSINEGYSWSSAGGGIYLVSGFFCEVEIIGNRIENNSCKGWGGGICCCIFEPVISNNLIRGNSAVTGGGLFLGTCAGEVRNNLIVSNIAFQGSGIVCIDGATPLIINNVIANNGGGSESIFFDYTSSPVIKNNIMSGNEGGIYSMNPWENPPILYCDFYGNTHYDFINCSPGEGCIFEDPQFVDEGAGDYRLMPSSPCRDAGDPSILDPDGTRSDIGAYGGGSAGWVAIEVGFPVGWNLVSVLRGVYGDDASSVFGSLEDGGCVIEDKLFEYTGLGYIRYPGGFSDVEVGRGYWLDVDVGGNYLMRGFEPEGEVEIELSEGWNLIGYPFIRGQVLGNCEVRDGEEEYTYQEAVEAGLIHEVVFGFDNGIGYIPTHIDEELQPWHGYWVLSAEDGLELIIPKPEE